LDPLGYIRRPQPPTLRHKSFEENRNPNHFKQSDLYLVLMSRTHSKQNVRGDDPPNSTSGSSELVTMRHIRLSPKIGFKTLNKEEEEGGTTVESATNGSTTTRILILKSEPRYSISEPP
jgi:hypothetical protein